MKKLLALVIAVVMIFALSVPAFADQEVRRFSMVVTPFSRTVFENGEKTTETTAGDVNAKLFTLLDTPIQNREGFAAMNIDFDYADRIFTAVEESITTKLGETYTVSDPNVVFMDNPEKLHATGDGEAVITVGDKEGNIVDEYTVTVKDGELHSVCSKCGEEQGTAPHRMVCGHYRCEDAPEHSGCTEHIHDWQLCWEAAHWNNKQSYPFYRCTVCGAEKNYDILPPIYYNPWAEEE